MEHKLMNEQISDLARQLAKEAAKVAIISYQNELLTLITHALENGYTKEQLIDALLLELGKDA
jgi:hypothetical protein